MNIYEYFDEEEKDIENKLEDLTANYEVWSVEKVFDAVKVVCDAIQGHLKKQNVLLIAPLQNNADYTQLIAQVASDHMKVEEEIGQLVEVHVDEPGYKEYLGNLLKVLKEHIAFSKKLHSSLKENLSEQEFTTMNTQFNEFVLHSTDFNQLQPLQ